jgi:hypothetical protein
MICVKARLDVALGEPAPPAAATLETRKQGRGFIRSSGSQDKFKSIRHASLAPEWRFLLTNGAWRGIVPAANAN